MLTSRQKDLLQFLKDNKNEWMSQRTICDFVDGYTYIDDTRNHCVDIGLDRLAINNEVCTDGIIVTKKHKFKYADFTDYITERKRLIRLIKGYVKQLRNIDYKAKNQNQAYIIDEFLSVIDDNLEYHVTFDN